MNQTTPTPANQPKRPSNWRSVLLPAEHGVWASLIESLLMGFFTSLTWQSLVVGINAILLGLCLQPCKIILRGPTNKYQIPRYNSAKRAFAILAPLSVALLIFNVIIPQISPAFALVLLISLPLVLIHWYYESSNQPRHIVAVISGMLAISFVAPAMVVADGPHAPLASAVLLVIAARQVSSIAYARFIVRRTKGIDASTLNLILFHLIALLFILLIPAIYPALPQPNSVFLLIIYAALCLRAIIGYSILKQRGQIKAKILGFTELAIGIIYILTTAYVLTNHL